MGKPTATGRPVAHTGQKGFSFLGLLFLLAGLGVALAALGTVWHTAAQREKERDLLFIGDQYRRAIASFWEKPLPVGAVRRLPKDFAELLRDPRFPNTVRHLRRIYRDPMTGDAEWGLVKETDGGISGVYSLSTGTPFRRANFPSAYVHFQEAQSYSEWIFRFDVEKAQRDVRQTATSGTAQAGAASPGVPDAGE